MSNSLAQDLAHYIHTSMGVPTADLDREALLFSSGLLDSFSLVDIVSFVEERTGLKIKPGDVQLNNFDSITRIEGFVARRLSTNP